MKREEWYESDKFKLLRLLNNVAHEITTKAQELRDLLPLLEAQYGAEFGLRVSDRYAIVDRQLRIVNLEAENLTSAIRHLEELLRPREFDDMVFEKKES